MTLTLNTDGLRLDAALAALLPELSRSAVQRLLEEEMSGVVHLSVPLPAQAHSGKTWLEAKG